MAEGRIAGVVNSLMCIWAREKILPLKALSGQGTAWWPMGTSSRALGESRSVGRGS